MSQLMQQVHTQQQQLEASEQQCVHLSARCELLQQQVDDSQNVEKQSSIASKHRDLNRKLLQQLKQCCVQARSDRDFLCSILGELKAGMSDAGRIERLQKRIADSVGAAQAEREQLEHQKQQAEGKQREMKLQAANAALAGLRGARGSTAHASCASPSSPRRTGRTENTEVGEGVAGVPGGDVMDLRRQVGALTENLKVSRAEKRVSERLYCFRGDAVVWPCSRSCD